MRITDNHYKIAREDFVAEFPKLSQALLDRTLDNLSIEDSIFIFPNDLKNSSDLERDEKSLKRSIRKLRLGM